MPHRDFAQRPGGGHVRTLPRAGGRQEPLMAEEQMEAKR